MKKKQVKKQLKRKPLIFKLEIYDGYLYGYYIGKDIPNQVIKVKEIL